MISIHFIISLVIFCFIIKNALSQYDRCTVNGDPHFYYFGDDNGHHYQGLSSNGAPGWYYIVPCKDPALDVLPTANRFNTDLGGLPFSIVGTHYECSSGRSCIDTITLDLYNDVGTKKLSFSLPYSGSGTDYEYSEDGGAATTISSSLSFTIRNDADDDDFLIVQVSDPSTVPISITVEMAGNIFLDLEFYRYTAPQIHIDIIDDETILPQICGLCGSQDGTGGQFTEEPADRRRRRLLQLGDIPEEETTDDTTTTTTGTGEFRAHCFVEDALGAGSILFLEDDGMISWSEMLAKGDVWELTMLYGDCWAVDVEITTNVSSTYFPSENCIDVGTDICTQFYNDADESTCSQCEDTAFLNENTELFAGFNRWLQGCIYDTCTAADVAGMALEALTYEEALAYGFLDVAGLSCDASCGSNFGQCPSACTDDDGNVIACDCSQDANCQNCQAQGQCSQCKSGYFMASQDNHFCYPCQEYAGEGCMFCQNHNGCGQCSQGYTRTKDDTCSFNGNNLWYCV